MTKIGDGGQDFDRFFGADSGWKAEYQCGIAHRNRNDFYEPPAYNLNALLGTNYCVAASLFDARMFRAGMRYAEDLIGHEDWDFVLQMAERGIEGELARMGTLLYRKRGFSRVKAVEYGPDSFEQEITSRHPLLYRRERTRIKARWAPALSIVLADGVDGTCEPWPADLSDRLSAQTCGDFETIWTRPAAPNVG